MNGSDTLERTERARAATAPDEGYAGQVVRLERRLGWVLWGALVVLLLWISL